MSDITMILGDCEHFIREFFPVISISAGQVYESALLFTPTQSKLRMLYASQMPQIVVNNGSGPKWSSCLCTMYGHFDAVLSVAFTTDGKRIVSGSADTSVQIWDAVSGAHSNTLKGHTDAVCSVAISHNDKRIASGSKDKTIMLWDTLSGARITRLEGHTNGVTSVTFSLNGEFLVSGAWGCSSPDVFHK